ncbi:MAG: hypothetical protein KC416_11560, partial [Myxococcales bacterium]|nr:hypothetical protein [Myxococcales bacterium]
MKRSFPFGVIPWVVVTLVGLGGFALGCGGPSAATETPPPASTVLPETLHRANLSARQGSTDET